MKRIVALVTLVGALSAAVPASAQDWGYGGGYPPQQESHPVLKKVLIGGALVGIGFLAGRLTAPKPQTSYYQPQSYPQVPPPQPGCARPIGNWQAYGQYPYRPY